jgi:hypothetical protein
MDLVSSGYGPVMGYCECSDDPSCSGATDLVGWLASYVTVSS